MTGYERLDAGQIRFKGKRLTNTSPDRVFALGIGRTFQLTRIFPRLTVIENMHVAVQRKGRNRFLRRWSTTEEQRRALELLEFVGIARTRDMPAGNLSYGQKKLLEFAYILIAEPQVILLDEPAGGINPTIINYLESRIRTLNEQGVTFLVVEHNLEFVMRLCHTVAVMHQGTMVAAGPPAQVREDPVVLEAYLGY
jgi:ABC-type branched-subunit amino acid transport system ATPase component